jgi:protein TonB
VFQDSLLDSGATDERQRLARVVSFLLEALLLALAVIVPLLQSVALPRLRDAFILPPPPRGGSSVRVVTGVTHSGAALPSPNTLTYKLREPRRIAGLSSHADVNVPTGNDSGPVGQLPGVPNGVAFGILPLVPTPAPPPHQPSPPRVKISSGVTEGFLIHKVQPVYPPIARVARVEGTVVLAALIARDGSIEQLRVLSGPPLLVSAAVDAVRQWRYRPYMLSNEAVEVETQIRINFRLQQ